MPDSIRQYFCLVRECQCSLLYTLNVAITLQRHMKDYTSSTNQTNLVTSDGCFRIPLGGYVSYMSIQSVLSIKLWFIVTQTAVCVAYNKQENLTSEMEEVQFVFFKYFPFFPPSPLHDIA